VSNDPTSAVTRTPQNIYDDATFFEGYKSLRDGDTGLNGALEIPALHRLLPRTCTCSTWAAASASLPVLRERKERPR
jgi:hypothetical protein